MTSFDYRLNTLYPVKECSSCGALYTTDYCCSVGSLGDKIICDLDKTPNLSQRSPQNCPKCGHPINGHYCQGCALLRKKFKEDLFTSCIKYGILQDSFEPSNVNTNVVNAPFDPKSDLVYDSPNVFDPPLQLSFISCEFCGNDARYGHYCTPQVPFVYPKPCYNQGFNFPQEFQEFHDFQQQNLCCENCGITHEAYQCQPKNADYYHEQNSCYDSNSFGFDQFQPQQYTVNHHIFNVQNDLFDSQYKLMEQLTSMCDMVGQFIQMKEEEKQIEEEQAANGRYWKTPACYDDDDDDYAFSITPNEPINSLSTRDEHLDTIPATKSDEFIKLLYDNSSPRPPEEFVSKNFDAEIKSFSSFPIPVEESDSLMEEIDLSFTPDYPMPSGIEDDDYDSERDILIHDELLSNDSFSLPENELFHFDIPSFSHPPEKPPDDNT
uniref:Pre-mRNA splicing Prp18-interacting factor n=1 Tax=Tanacetum cinerariifolium TaxID=118510 RepID=A0A699K300_TANCI|nr:hypothetical protein [Tanacetum cinerariifolium]